MAVWVKDDTVNARNEPLDCTNYAQAAFYGFQINLDENRKTTERRNQIIRKAENRLYRKLDKFQAEFK